MTSYNIATYGDGCQYLDGCTSQFAIADDAGNHVAYIVAYDEENDKEFADRIVAALNNKAATEIPPGWKLVPDFQVGMIVLFGGEKYKIFAHGGRPGTFDICHPTDDHRDRWLNVPPDQLEPLTNAAPPVQAQDKRWQQSSVRDPLAYAKGYSDGTKNALDITAQAQPVINQQDRCEAFEGWVRKELGDPIRLTMRERNLGAQAWAAATRAALAQQPSGQDREDAADMFWDADDPERFGGDNLHDTLVDLADDYGDPDFPVTVRLQCAKRLPDVQVVVTGRNDDGELVYEVIDAARAAKEPK